MRKHIPEDKKFRIRCYEIDVTNRIIKKYKCQKRYPECEKSIYERFFTWVFPALIIFSVYS